MDDENKDNKDKERRETQKLIRSVVKEVLRVLFWIAVVILCVWRAINHLIG